MNSQRFLILSDGKPGHVNQSIAFAKHLGRDYDLSQVHFNSRWSKGLSYLFDRCGILTPGVYSSSPINGQYSAIISAGSETYYANRVLAHELRTKSVAIMLPKGYRYDFDLIVAQQHDNPPHLENVISLPVNLSYIEPQGLVMPQEGRKVVSLIIGGDSRHSILEPADLRQKLEMIFPLFPDHDFWMTTSRRTSPANEAVLKEFSFSYALYFSKDRDNPISDFLQHSDYVFLTADSTSMISEAVSYGNACIEVLPLSHSLTGTDKFSCFFQRLLEDGCLHLFDGQLGRACEKVDLSRELRGITL